MFGSLIVVFPTFHEGGALLLRHRDHEWIVDSGQALAGVALGRPSIGYVAFLNDIEQDVAPVTSGHCVTLTYNLYFDDDGGPASEKGALSQHLIPPKPLNQDRFREAFNALLGNPEFMADGGTLAFGLRRDYQIDCGRSLAYVHNVLKGSDAVVYQCMRALGFEPRLHILYGNEYDAMVVHELIHIDEFIDEDQDDSVEKCIRQEGGTPVRQNDGILYQSDLYKPESVEWVTPLTTYTRIKNDYAECVKTRIDCVYGKVCMIVRIGKAGDRLAFPTVAQIEKAYRRSGYFDDSRLDSRVYYNLN